MPTMLNRWPRASDLGVSGGGRGRVLGDGAVDVGDDDQVVVVPKEDARATGRPANGKGRLVDPRLEADGFLVVSQR